MNMDGNGCSNGISKVHVPQAPDGDDREQPRAPIRRTRTTSRSWDENGSNHSPLTNKEHNNIYLASMILSRIDTESYEHAAWEDADRIMRNHILPRSLPWHKPRVPLLRSLPRDIEDMQGVWHAGNDEEDEVFREHDNSGPFGLGMFDMGGLTKDDVKGTRADTIIASKPISTAMRNEMPVSPGNKRRLDSVDEYDSSDGESDSIVHCSNKFHAAARRGNDSGVIELTVKLPLPSLTSCLLNSQRRGILPEDPGIRHDKASINLVKSITQAERAENCSSMPLYWSKIDKHSFTEPPAFSDLAGQRKIDISNNETIFSRMQKREKRKRKIASLQKACTRNWRVSVKVANVTSRRDLIHPTSRPMYCMAVFPAYVQCGQSLTIESAQIKDKEEGIRELLGSYDCRATTTNPSMSFDAMDNEDYKPTKYGGGRSKRINIGRSRLIWSKVRMRSSKPLFTSILTGQRLDAATYKRPKDLKVTVRLNGKVLSEVDEEGTSKTSTHSISTDKVTWSTSKVHRAVMDACGEKVEPVTPEIVESEELLHTAECSFDPEDYLNKLVKRIKSQTTKNASVKDKSDFVRIEGVDSISLPSFSQPVFSCLPLEDGFMRTHCDKYGTLKGLSTLHKLLSELAMVDRADPVCTVCWTGSETYAVLKCMKCGLFLHRQCSLDGGADESSSANGPSWKCAVCKGTPYIQTLPKLLTQKHEENLPHLPQGSRKSQRTSRLPTRFKETKEEDGKEQTYLKGIAVKSSIPKCTLCPHSGGAMIITNQGDINSPQRWTHDVCRIWCTKQETRQNNTTEIVSTSSLSSRLFKTPTRLSPMQPKCCLCGMGSIHNEGEETEEVLQAAPSASQGIGADHIAPGLIKCAAANCNIYFHPMCAQITTKLSQAYGGSLPLGEKPSDNLICQQYTLAMAEVTTTEQGEEKSNFVPIGFCGLHNPDRDDDLYGCMPRDNVQSQVLSDSMHIPYQ